MTDKRSNPAHRAIFEATMRDVRRALESRCRQKTRAELECLAAQITRLRLQRGVDGSVLMEHRGAI